jgi:hypothetical protein
MIDQGVDGICILANYSEQFLLTDDERNTLVDLCLTHVAGRVPVIVTCSHFSTQIATARARKAAAAGAAMLMMMPPYHGASLRADEKGMLEHFARVADAARIPIMVQDAPLSGVDVKVSDLTGPARLPKESVELFKEWYLNVTRRSAQDYSLGTGWYPDALIPCTHWTGKLFPKSYILPFAVPDLLNNIGPDQRNQAVWVDIYIPKDRKLAPAGTYESTITVSSPPSTPKRSRPNPRCQLIVAHPEGLTL